MGNTPSEHGPEGPFHILFATEDLHRAVLFSLALEDRVLLFFSVLFFVFQNYLYVFMAQMLVKASLELQLQAVVGRYTWILGANTGSSARAVCELLTGTPFLQPHA